MLKSSGKDSTVGWEVGEEGGRMVEDDGTTTGIDGRAETTGDGGDSVEVSGKIGEEVGGMTVTASADGAGAIDTEKIVWGGTSEDARAFAADSFRLIQRSECSVSTSL